MAVYASRRAGYPRRPGNYRVYNNVDCKMPTPQAGSTTLAEDRVVQEVSTVQNSQKAYVHEERGADLEVDCPHLPPEMDVQQETYEPETQEPANSSMPDLSALISSLGGAEGISATINNILGMSSESPDTNASATIAGPAAQSNRGTDGIDLSSLLSGLGGQSALGGLGNLGNTGSMLSGLLGKSGNNCNSSCNRLCSLTSALSPFLSPGRRVRADKILKIMQLLATAEQPVFDDDRLPLIMIFVYLFF